MREGITMESMEEGENREKSDELRKKANEHAKPVAGEGKRRNGTRSEVLRRRRSESVHG